MTTNELRIRISKNDQDIIDIINRFAESTGEKTTSKAVKKIIRLYWSRTSYELENSNK